MDDADGRSEPEFQGARSNNNCVLRIVNAAANHRVDVHVKYSVL